MSDLYETKVINRRGVGMNSPLSDLERQQVIRRLQHISRLMDKAVRIPGTRKSFGLDSIIGLVPGVGDTVTSLVSLYIVYEANRLGVSRATIARMIANIGIDAVLGSIPLLGDVFDFFFKANVKNLALLGIDTPEADAPKPSRRR